MRRSKRERKDPEMVTSKETRAGMTPTSQALSQGDKKIIFEALQRYDVHDVKAICRALPHKSPELVYRYMKNRKIHAKLQKIESRHEEVDKQAPIDKWLTLALEETQKKEDLSYMLTHVMGICGKLEPHLAGRVSRFPKYDLIYAYLQALMKGQIPPKLGVLEAAVVLNLMESLISDLMKCNITKHVAFMIQRYNKLRSDIEETHRVKGPKPYIPMAQRRKHPESEKDDLHLPFKKRAVAANNDTPVAEASTSSEGNTTPKKGPDLSTINPLGVPVTLMDLHPRAKVVVVTEIAKPIPNREKEGVVTENNKDTILKEKQKEILTLVEDKNDIGEKTIEKQTFLETHKMLQTKVLTMHVTPKDNKNMQNTENTAPEDTQANVGSTEQEIAPPATKSKTNTASEIPKKFEGTEFLIVDHEAKVWAACLVPPGDSYENQKKILLQKMRQQINTMKKTEHVTVVCVKNECGRPLCLQKDVLKMIVSQTNIGHRQCVIVQSVIVPPGQITRHKLQVASEKRFASQCDAVQEKAETPVHKEPPAPTPKYRPTFVNKRGRPFGIRPQRNKSERESGSSNPSSSTHFHPNSPNDKAVATVSRGETIPKPNAEQISDVMSTHSTVIQNTLTVNFPAGADSVPDHESPLVETDGDSEDGNFTIAFVGDTGEDFAVVDAASGEVMWKGATSPKKTSQHHVRKGTGFPKKSTGSVKKSTGSSKKTTDTSKKRTGSAMKVTESPKKGTYSAKKSIDYPKESTDFLKKCPISPKKSTGNLQPNAVPPTASGDAISKMSGEHMADSPILKSPQKPKPIVVKKSPMQKTEICAKIQTCQPAEAAKSLSASEKSAEIPKPKATTGKFVVSPSNAVSSIKQEASPATCVAASKQVASPSKSQASSSKKVASPKSVASAKCLASPTQIKKASPMKDAASPVRLLTSPPTPESQAVRTSRRKSANPSKIVK